MGQAPSSNQADHQQESAATETESSNSTTQWSTATTCVPQQQTPINQGVQQSRHLSIQLSNIPPPALQPRFQRTASESNSTSSRSSFELIDSTPSSATSTTSSHRAAFEVVSGLITRTPSIEVVGSAIDRVESFPSTPLIASKSHSYSLTRTSTPTLTLTRKPSFERVNTQLDEDEEKYPVDLEQQQKWTPFSLFKTCFPQYCDLERPDYTDCCDSDPDEGPMFYETAEDVKLSQLSCRVRPRHQSKSSDRPSFKSRRTRKRWKEETAIRLLRAPTQDKFECRPPPPLRKVIVTKPECAAYPFLSILHPPSYFLQLYSPTQMKHFAQELKKLKRDRSNQESFKAKRSHKDQTQSRHRDRTVSKRLSTVESILEVELSYDTDEEVYPYYPYEDFEPVSPVATDCFCCDCVHGGDEDHIYADRFRWEDDLDMVEEEKFLDIWVEQDRHFTHSWYANVNESARFGLSFRTRHRHIELGQTKKSGKKTRKEMKELKMLANQNREDLEQQWKAQPTKVTLHPPPDSIDLTPPLPASLSVGHQPPDRRKKSTRHGIPNTSPQPRRDYSTKPRRSSQPHESLLPANVFKNANKKDRKKNQVIHLRDLSQALLMNAVKVESGELKLTTNKRFPPPTQKLNYATSRAYLGGYKNGREKHRPFHWGWWDHIVFQSAFIQLFRTRIEQTMASAQVAVGMGIRIVSIDRYGGPCPSYEFFMNLLQDLNRHRVGADHPATTEIELRFYPFTHAGQWHYLMNPNGYSSKNIHHLFASGQESILSDELDEKQGENLQGSGGFSLPPWLNPDWTIRLPRSPPEPYRRMAVKAFLKGDHLVPIDHTNHYDVGSIHTVVPVAEIKYELIPIRVPFREIQSKPIRAQLKRIKEQHQQHQLNRKKAARLTTLDRAYDTMVKNERVGPWTRFHAGFDSDNRYGGRNYLWYRFSDYAYWDDYDWYCSCNWYSRLPFYSSQPFYQAAAERMARSVTYACEMDDEDDLKELPRRSIINPRVIHPNLFQVLEWSQLEHSIP